MRRCGEESGKKERKGRRRRGTRGADGDGVGETERERRGRLDGIEEEEGVGHGSKGEVKGDSRWEEEKYKLSHKMSFSLFG